jgi:hypothetical protein
MAGVQALDFDSPDETRAPEKTRVDVVRIGGTTAGRFAFDPGWRWSECIKPVAGTDSCQARHVGVVQSGTLRVAHEDGSELDLRAGDAYVIEPGHDAWVRRAAAFEQIRRPRGYRRRRQAPCPNLLKLSSGPACRISIIATLRGSADESVRGPSK